MNKKTLVKFINKDGSQFYTTLKQRVDNYFTGNNLSRNANAKMIIKTFALFGFYLIPFVLILVFQPIFPIMLALWMLMGFGLAGVGMSVMHDANHGAYSVHRWVNLTLSHSLNLLGGSVTNWRMQHNILHHTYTNITPLDEDIADKGILRFNPHTRVKKIQKGQFVYAFFLYSITTLYWVALKDIVQYIRFVKTGMIRASKMKRTWNLTRIVFDKLLYIAIFVGLPLAVGIPVLSVMVGFLIMHFIAGQVLTVVFQLAHTVDGTGHPVPDEHGKISTCWAVHQMHTTVNFSQKNKFITWYVGGLNFQVEHHLFPKICHIHYPALAPIVEQTALEFGIPYLRNHTFGSAVKSHLRTLKRFGNIPAFSKALD